MYWQKAGFKPKVEQIASHTRRRYRLTGSNQGMGPQGDPSLWLIHYSKAQPRDQHPANHMQMMPHAIQQFQQRQVIQASGALPRKEFMFSDRSSWPVINLPSTLARQRPSTHLRSLSQYEATVEEEEDVSRGDALDFMTPREISRMRYEQHHEWMEEVLDSPFGIRQIIPPELGIGRTGTLESFTADFFTAHTSTITESMNDQIEKLSPGRAEDFTKLANQKLAAMQTELEQMKQRHIRRMEKLKKTSDLAAAERKLRSMSMNRNESFGPIVREVEAIVGKRIEPAKKINRVAAGGMQEIRPTPQVPQVQPQQSPQPQLSQKQTPDQQHESAPRTEQSTPFAAQQGQHDQVRSIQAQIPPQSLPESQSVGTPQDDSMPARISEESPQAEAADIDMSGLDEGNLEEGDAAAETGDWDMLGDQGLDNENMNNGAQNQDAQVRASNDGDDQDVAGNVETFDMVNDFDDNNMDTAGDALADYGTGEVDGDDLNLNDSAFDDAFHHEQEES